VTYRWEYEATKPHSDSGKNTIFVKMTKKLSKLIVRKPTFAQKSTFQPNSRYSSFWCFFGGEKGLLSNLLVKSAFSRFLEGPKKGPKKGWEKGVRPS